MPTAATASVGGAANATFWSVVMPAAGAVATSIVAMGSGAEEEEEVVANGTHSEFANILLYCMNKQRGRENFTC